MNSNIEIGLRKSVVKDISENLLKERGLAHFITVNKEMLKDMGEKDMFFEELKKEGIKVLEEKDGKFYITIKLIRM